MLRLAAVRPLTTLGRPTDGPASMPERTPPAPGRRRQGEASRFTVPSRSLRPTPFDLGLCMLVRRGSRTASTYRPDLDNSDRWLGDAASMTAEPRIRPDASASTACHPLLPYQRDDSRRRRLTRSRQLIGEMGTSSAGRPRMNDGTLPNPADFGYDPADFGADEIRVVRLGASGYHWTAYSRTGGQISWNTDLEGNYIDHSPDPRYGPEVHMSDRNVKGPGVTNVWHRGEEETEPHDERTDR